MAKEKLQYQCQECGHVSPKWLGRCSDCGSWNSYSEELYIAKNSKQRDEAEKRLLTANHVHKSPKPLNELQENEYERFYTNISEFDRVMGGGITVGSLTLIGGEPGIGKSTLLMEVCGKLVKKYQDDIILYVSGEESEYQIASRAKRLGIENNSFLVLHETNWEKIKNFLKELKPKFLVLDSIQTTVSSEIQSAGGTVSQVREVTYELMNYTKDFQLTSFVIGHVTKEGNIAGPKILEHMVDTVIYFEGDQHYFYRILRVMKNRFGNTQEVGLFEMQETGLHEVTNPSQYFLDQGLEGSFGRAITCLLEGTRPLLVEVQALVTENKYGTGRRTTQGVDTNRVAMLVAILEKYFELPFNYCDIYVNVVGGIKLEGREADLAILAALLSSYHKKEITQKTVFMGEVGLTGEVRPIRLLKQRIKEIEKLGYSKAVISKRNQQMQAFDKTDLPKIHLDFLERVTDLKKLLIN